MDSTVLVSRPTYNDENFHQTYDVNEKNRLGYREQLQRFARSQTQCSLHRFWKILVSFFPVFLWLPKYKKKYIVGDLIAGWTVGVIRIPQGMAYALLAGVQPVFGLYSCFFPVLLWFVFSTSKHTSVGTMAVVCLMIQNLIDIHVPDIIPSYNGTQLLLNGKAVDLEKVDPQYIITDSENNRLLNDSSFLDDKLSNLEAEKIQVACSATLLVGIIQLSMALLRLGFLTTLLSDPVIQGFTTGAAFHVMMSQVKYLFGLAKYVGKYNGPFALFKTLGDILHHLPQSNIADVIISAIALPTLLVVKYLNERYKQKLRNIPIPVELILVVLATVISYFGNLDDPPYNVNIVKTIPTGFPDFSMPSRTDLWSEMVTDCLIMAFISVAISLSLTKIYSDKHGYDVDANQEIFALGICNTIPAFLSSFAVAASLSRTAIQESTGGKTQLVSILSSILMLIVLIWLAPLFEPVPKSLLACIIIVALKSLFKQFEKLKELFLVSKIDFTIWVVTCFSVVVLGVDLGLAVGVAMAIAALIYRIQHPKHVILGRIMHTDLYADHKKYKDAYEIPGVKIFHYADSVSFTNKDAFRNSLYKAVGSNPSTILSKIEKRKKKGGNLAADSETRLIRMEEFPTSRTETSDDKVRKRSNLSPEGASTSNNNPAPLMGFHVLIFDATMWSFIDSTASREIIQIIVKFQSLGVTVLIAGASGNVINTLDGCGLTSHLSRDRVFVTVHDAVVHAERIVQQQLRRNDESFEEPPFSSMPDYPGFDSLAL
uniref:Solute carrier family 26 member 10-like n=1 Tax=Phallusia mammillata TaxID=59560 RepID=A0A6F9DRX2_9ASCI|nr:solute carrier family 26 member 10-like [Phallusia mammillata]